MNDLCCMIPVRKGSQRIPGKALRKVGDLSLLEQAITLALTFFPSTNIYLNTDWTDLEVISKKYKINFYKREMYTCSSSTNDEFMNDFLSKIDCKRVVQLVPTSPFLLKEEFKGFCNKAAKCGPNALISVGVHRIASVLEDGTPINFDRDKQNPPSQTMQAIYTYACALMSWDRQTFLRDYKYKKCAYHGSNLIEYYPLSLLSQLDIDTEEDLKQAQLLSILRPNHKIK